MTRVRSIITGALLAFLLSHASQAGAQEAGPVQRGPFNFYFDQPTYIDGSDSVLTRTRLQLTTMLQDSLAFTANVYLVDNIEAFERLIRGRFPDWGAAAAFAPRQRIVIKSPDKFSLGKPLWQLLAHEYTHLAVSHRTGLFESPRWFTEGLAQMVSTEWSWTDNLAMGKAAVFGQFIPLHEIELMNRFNQSKAGVAYSQSYLAVKYFYDTYGANAVNIFLDRVRDGASLDDALMASTGSDYAQFEHEFQTFFTTRYNLVTLMADTMWLWLALALVVVIGAYLKFRKRRHYYRKWEEEEKYHSTDFDYGDPRNPEKPDDDEPWRQ